jgi:hypothetical protein
MTEEKKRGGRPRRVPNQRLVRLQINLDPKVKFGLDLLARAQGRSLSQSIEWALQSGFRHEMIHGGSLRKDTRALGDVIDELWEIKEPKLRLVRLWEVSPTFVEFDERAVCELVATANEARDSAKTSMSHVSYKERLSNADWTRLTNEMRDEYWRFVVDRWSTLEYVASKIRRRGDQLNALALYTVLRNEGEGKVAEELNSRLFTPVHKWLPSIG